MTTLHLPVDDMTICADCQHVNITCRSASLWKCTKGNGTDPVSGCPTEAFCSNKNTGTCADFALKEPEPVVLEPVPDLVVPQPSKRAFKVRWVLAWYDLWVGAYWDRRSRTLYLLPIPCVGVAITWSSSKE